jgi:hypothetical protein
MEKIKPREQLKLDLPPHWNKWKRPDDLWQTVKRWSDVNYPEHIAWVRSTAKDAVTPERFWREYVWCSCVAGFNAAVVTGFFDKLMDTIGRDPFKVKPDSLEAAMRIFGNRRKLNGIYAVAAHLQAIDWVIFSERYFDFGQLSTAEVIANLDKLPNVGSIIAHHLARNLGFDTVKPDLHLIRVAQRFGFSSPHALCSYLSVVYDIELLGEVDLRLFLYCQTYGTLELVDREEVAHGQQGKRARKAQRPHQAAGELEVEGISHA